MKKTSIMVTCFAVVLMLATTCMARPAQEKVSIESVEFAEKELMNSFEAFSKKLELIMGTIVGSGDPQPLFWFPGLLVWLAWLVGFITMAILDFIDDVLDWLELFFGNDDDGGTTA